MIRVNGKLKIDNYWILAVLFIVVKLCLHFSTNTNYELHRDEMLYFNMGSHLSFGYATVPPLTGFLAFIVKVIFGYSVFGIRLIPALLGAASIFIIAKTIRDIGGGILALVIASSSFILSTGFLLFDTLLTPNVTEQFLWLLTTYLLFRMISKDNPRLWIWIGIILGLAFLNKYSVLIYILGFFIAMLLTDHRKLFNSRYFYYSVIIGIMLILPNLLWQYSHGWPVLNHMDELKRTQMVNMRFLNYFIEIFSLNSVSTFIWIGGLISLLVLKREKKNQFIGVASLLIILFFLFSKGKGYYILGLIPFLFAIGGYSMEKYLKDKLVFINYVILFITISFSLIAFPYGIPLFSFDELSRYSKKTDRLIIYPFHRWEDGEIHPISQVYSDMTGWHELAGYVARAYSQLTKEEQKKCTIYVERDYGNAGAIHFYGKEYNLPDAITFLESYVMWAPDTIPDGPFIYINTEIGDIKKLFNNVKQVGCISDQYSREKGLLVFLCTDPGVNVQEVYRKKAIEEKKLYRQGRDKGIHN
jgi:MFS family permease